MMTAPGATAASVAGVPLPKVGSHSRARLPFGDLALGAFLLTQVLDGLCTYLGVHAFGIRVEANPVIAALMTHLGHGPGLLSAKIIAGGLGICLYLRQIHSMLALLAGFYATAAIVPWTALLFF
jgi:Domain of unknown function (DUF5658)